MAKLDFNDTLTTDTPHLASWLRAQGFQDAGPGRWVRGSQLGAWLGMTPKSWPAEVRLEDGRLHLAVRATGQILTRAESAYWEAEWASIQSAAHGQLTDTTALAHRRDVSLVENLLVLGSPLPIGAVIGVVVAVSAGWVAGLITGAISAVALCTVGVIWLVMRR